MSQQTPQKRVLLPRVLTSIVLGFLSMVTILYGGFAYAPQTAYAAVTNSTVNFQARLEGIGGSIAADGLYNIQFKLYSVSTGGAALWTESYYDSNGVTAGNDNRVQVANGYVTVSLGSQTAFPTTINWDQDLYITMNVGGTTQTATPTYDGEMNPRLRLTGVPYAFRAGQLAQYNATSGFTSTLSILQPTVGNQVFQLADQAAAGTYTLCIQGSAACGFATGTATSYVQNTATLQTGTTNFNISGTGTAATSILTPLVDTATAVALNIGTTNATSINLKKNTVVTGTLTASGVVSTTSGGAAGTGTQALASNLYIQSRGTNLVTNGMGQLGNNYNFTTLTYDGQETYGGFGSFKSSTANLTTTSDELIPVNPNKTYQLDISAKSTTYVAGNHAYFGIAPYDADGLAITPFNYAKYTGATDTTLAAPLNPGDTTVTLTDATGWSNSINGYSRNFGWYGYTNARGYTYPDYTYTRTTSNTYSDFGTNGAWAQAGISGNVITLRSAWAGPTLASGSAIRNITSGSTYKYISATNTVVPATWQSYSGRISGLDTDGSQGVNEFPYGTASIKLLTMLNRDVAGNATNISAISFTDNSGVFTAQTLSAIPVVIQGATGQTADLLNVQNATGTILSKIDASGNLTATNITATGGTISGTTLQGSTSVQTPLLDTASAVALNIGTTNATAINLNKDTTVAAGKSITLVGGITSTRPASPAEGMLYYDTTTKQLLVYANAKWQSYSGNTATKIVSMGTATGCTGTVPVAGANPEGADYVVTSCTSAQTVINTALTAAATAGGGTVYLMEGTYIIDGTISIPDKVSLVGSGAGTLVKFKNGINATMTGIANTNNTTGTAVAIRNFTLDGNKANQSSGNQIGIVFSNMGGGTGGSAREGGQITNMTVRNIYNAAGTSAGIQMVNSNNSIISNNMLVLNDYIGLWMSGSSYNTISGNIAQGNGTHAGFYVGSTSNGNTFNGNTSQGNVYGIFLSTVSYTTLTGNTFQGNTIGINLASVSYSTVTGNTTSGNTSYGINLSTATYTTVSGNKVHDNSGATANNGIFLVTSTNNTISGNDITDTGCSTTCYAINISDTGSTNNYLSGNRYSTTSGTVSIQDLATTSIYANQLNSTGQLVNSASGALVSRLQASASNDLFQAQDSSGNALLKISNTGTLTVGRASNVTGTLVLQNSTNANTVTLASGVVSTSYTVTLPTAVGTAGQCLTIGSVASGNAQMSFASCSAGSVTLQGVTPGTADTGNFNITGTGIAGILQAGTTSNGITLSSSGILFSGTARTSKTISLPAEYAGAVLDPSGSNNVGTMTSGLDLTNRMNYYKWTTTSGTNQSYDVALQVPLPTDFSAWSSNPLSVSAYTTSTTNGTITLEARDTAGAVQCNFVSVTPGSTSTWTANTTGCTLASGTYAAGGYITLRIRMQSGTGGDTRIGNITLSYLSKY